MIPAGKGWRFGPDGSYIQTQQSTYFSRSIYKSPRILDISPLPNHRQLHNSPEARLPELSTFWKLGLAFGAELF